MPNKNSINSTVETKTRRRSPRFSTHNSPPEQVQIPATRRSLRFLKQNDNSAPKVTKFRHSQSANRQVNHSDGCFRSSRSISLKTDKGVLENSAKKSSKPGDISSKNEDLNTGSKKSPTLGKGLEENRIPRRSPRFSFVRNIDNELEDCYKKCSKNSATYDSSDLKNFNLGFRRSPRLNNVVSGNQSIRKSRSISCEQYALHKSSRNREKSSSSGDNVNLLNGQNGETKAKVSSDPVTIAAKVGEADCDVKKKSVDIRKRKHDDEVTGITQGWTKEQEAALQKAYYSAKPTPQFWKKVSKLVPGRSAQECFDKVQSDYSTPPQPRTRSRARGIEASEIEFLSFSEDKLLNPDNVKSLKPSCKKQKSQFAQKTVRYLLQKNYQGTQNCETDLFSLFEPNINISDQSTQPSRVCSTPKDLKGKQGFIHICHERSSSNHKKPLSRFSSSVETIVVSPPVLKQVKNKALHEKYIDQLHNREAKRKASSQRSKTCSSKQNNVKVVDVARTDKLRAAKNALISDARDAINQFQHLHTNATINSPDSDGGDYYDNLDNENEDEIYDTP